MRDLSIQLFVDTNIYLAFYHYTKDELEEIKKLIFLIRDRRIKLFITQQVIDEFARNRERKINDALKQINEKFKFGGYPSFCKEFPAFDELEATIGKAKSLQSQLFVYTKQKILSFELEADKVLTELFRSGETLEVSDSLLEKAKKRVTIGNPPGKAGSYGDAINWEIILENCEIFDDLHIVTHDSDFYSIFNGDKINPFLKTEYMHSTIGDVTCYRSLSSFFKLNFPQINLKSEQSKEVIVNNIVNSPNFASSRAALKELKKFTAYSTQQIEAVLSACFTNNQILWIMADHDIKDMIWDFYTKNIQKVDEGFIEDFMLKWDYKFPIDEGIID